MRKEAEEIKNNAKIYLRKKTNLKILENLLLIIL